MRCEGGIIAAAMLGVQHQRQIQNLGFKIGIFAVRPQHIQNVLGRAQIFLGRVNVQALLFMVMGIGLISVYGQKRKPRDQWPGSAWDQVNRAEGLPLTVEGYLAQAQQKELATALQQSRLRLDSLRLIWRGPTAMLA